MAVNRRWMVAGVVLFAVGAAALSGYFLTTAENRAADSATPAGELVAENEAESPNPALAETRSNTAAATVPTTAVATPALAQAANTGAGRIYGTVRLPDDAPRGLTVTIAVNDVSRDFVDFSGARDALATTTVTTGGRYDLGGLPVGGHEVMATAPGYMGLERVELTPRKSEATVDLWMYPIKTVSGRVVDESGAGVANTLISVTGATTARYRDLSPHWLSLRVKSSSDGRFTLTTPPVQPEASPRYQLLAKADGYAPTMASNVRPGDREIAIVLRAGSAVSGMLVDAATGAPLPEKQVVLVSEITTLAPSTTDAEGFFFLTDVPPGPQQVKLDDADLVVLPETAAFTVTAGAPTDELVLRAAKGGTISGRVYDEGTKAGIEGVTITAAVDNERFDHSQTATSGPNGEYTLAGLASEAYSIRYDSPEGYAGRSVRRSGYRQVVARIGGEITGVDFALKRGLRITGRVEDEDGNPIAGAHVRGYQTDSGIHDTVSARADGTFTLSGYAPGDSVNVEASMMNHAPVRIEPGGEVRIESTDVNGVKIVLGPESTIRGIVVNARGQPQSDVEMYAQNAKGEHTAWATSRADGSILFEELSAGEYKLRFDADFVFSSTGEQNDDAVQTVVVRKGEQVTGVRIVAPEAGGLTISGYVEDTRGKPVSRTTITAFGNMNFADATTNDKGAFTLKGLKEGRYQLSVMSESYSNPSSLTAAAGTKDLKIVLKDLATLEGRVVDAATGNPVQVFDIRAQKKTNMFGIMMAMPDLDPATTHDPEGRFQLKDVEDGTTELIVSAEGYSETTQTIPTVTGGETRRDILVRLSAGASLTGRVTDASGKPVAGAGLSIASGNVFFDLAKDQVGATTSGDGTYQLTSLTPGTVKLTVAHRSYPNMSVSTNVVAGAANRFDIVISNGGTVEGRVTLDGKPVPDQAVHVYGSDLASMDLSGEEKRNQTDSSGRYRVSGVAPGSAAVSIDVEYNGYSRSRNERVDVRDGMVTQLDFNFVSGTSAIEGTIFEREGVPANEPVDLRVSVGRESIEAESDEDGRYAIEGIPSGTAVISIEREMSVKTLTVEVPANERVRKDILLGGGATVRVALTDSGTPAMMTMVMLMAGTGFDLAQLSFEDLESAHFQPAGMTMATSDEAVLEGLEPGTYTLYVVKFDPANMESFENPFTSSNTTSKVIDVKQDQTLTVEMEL